MKGRLSLIAGLLAFAIITLAVPPALAGEVSRAANVEASSSIQATEYMRSHAFWQLIAHAGGVIWSAFGLWLMLHTGMSARLRDQVNELTKNSFGRIAVYYASLALSLLAFTLPVYIVGDHFLEVAYQQERQSFFVWLLGRLFDTTLDIIVTVPGLWIIFQLINRFPKWWGALLFAVLVPVTIARIVLSPIALDQMKQGFQPLPEGALRERLVRIANKCGIEKPVLLVEEVRPYTSELNAYVTGMGDIVRIVVYDTTLDSLKDDEIEVMVAHEIGHYRMNHLWLRSAVGLIWIGIVLAVVSPLAPGMVRLLPKRWGIQGLGDIAIIPAAWMACFITNLMVSPLTHGFGRYMEQQADLYALEQTKNPDAMIRELRTYARLNVVDPDPSPLVVLFFHNHPPISERVRYTNQWKASHPSRSTEN